MEKHFFRAINNKCPVHANGEYPYCTCNEYWVKVDDGISGLDEKVELGSLGNKALREDHISKICKENGGSC